MQPTNSHVDLSFALKKFFVVNLIISLHISRLENKATDFAEANEVC